MYFFVNPAALAPQLPAQAYGPVVGQETTSYRVTSKFCVTADTPAIAALAGVVLVQLHDKYPDDLCNLAIKVSDIDDSRAQFDRVDYIIYRGLRRSTLFTSAQPAALAPLQPTGANSDLLQQAWAAYVVDQPLYPAVAPPTTDWLGLNYSNALPDTTLEAGFANAQYNKHLLRIKAGASLGNFADKVGSVAVDAGIEFVLVDRFYQPTLADLRAPEMLIQVPASTDPAGHETDYAAQRTRENILNYIDPAAYYTMHYRGGVAYTNGGPPPPLLTDAGAIADTLLGAFGPSKNRLYLDIRNDLGGSLNFYRDNEGVGADANTHFKIGFTDAQPLQATSYYTNSWPIFSVVVNSAAANRGNLYLAFLQAYNPKPLLFVDYCYGYHTDAGTELLTTENRFKSLAAPGATWSQPLNLKLVPPVSSSGHPVWFVKLMCIRQQMPATVPANGSIPLRNHPLDYVFFPLSAELINPSAPTGTLTVLPSKRYVGAVGDGVGTMVEVSVMLTQNLAVFRAHPLLTPEPPVLVTPRTYSEEDEQPWQLLPGIKARKSIYQDSTGKTVSFIKQTVSDTGVRAPNQDILALTILRSQLVTELIPATNSFAPTIDESRLVAATALRTQATLKAVSVPFFNIPYEVPDQHYWMLNLKVAGLTSSGSYLASNPFTSVVHAYTLDNVNFFTDESLNGLNLDITSNPDGYFSTDDLIKYVKIVEKVYYDVESLGDHADSNALQTCTRIRVHSYGAFADAENITPTNLLRIPIINPIGTVVDKLKQTGPAEYVKGAGFVASLPRARYVADRKGFNDPVLVAPAIRLLAAQIRLRAADLAQVDGGLEAYHHLVASADENGIGDNPSPYVRVLNTAAATVPHYNIDLGHALYGFEAWQIGQNATKPGYKAAPLGIKDATDLAGIIADVATAGAEFFYDLQHPTERRFSGPDYPAPGEANALRKYYDHSAPEADLYGDADGIGLDNAYRSLAIQPGAAADVRLSDVLTVYYSPVPGTTRAGLRCQRNPLGYHHSRRWFNLARRFNFIMPFSNPNDLFKYEDDKIFDEHNFVWINDALSANLTTLFGPTFQQARTAFRTKIDVFAHFWYIFLLNDPSKLLRRIAYEADVELITTDIFTEQAKSAPIRTLLDTTVNDFFLADLKAAILAENPTLVFRTS